MITTRESINYQFSLLFGYSSPNEFIVGDVIGPGNLTKNKVKDISISVIKFLRMYNAMLRDYTGSEVFSIEFELYNYDFNEAQVKIFPKSMILIPGRFKECESLLLALKPETGYLDVHTSRDSINEISALFYEVEEFTDRPDLIKSEKEQVLNRFASRFSKKLFGELIEDKWNKKLIGLSISLPTEKEMLNTYATVKSDVEVLWHKKPIEINFLNSRFEKIKTPFEDQQKTEHIKYSISAPSANFVVDNTLKLGTNLINLANTGTIDESQNNVISYIINYLEKKIERNEETHTASWLISYAEELLSNVLNYFKRFLNHSKDFLISGERGDLSVLLEKFKVFVIDKGTFENKNFDAICEIAMNSIDQSILQKKDVRANELESAINYFSEIIDRSLKIIKNSLPNYLSRRKLKTSVIAFIRNLSEKFHIEQEPVRLLSISYLDKFEDFLFKQLEISPLILGEGQLFDENKLMLEVKKLLDKNVKPFFDALNLDISDIVNFAENKMEKDSSVITTHIEKFKRFSGELHYLLSYICRYSTINRYLKEESDIEISDPVSFANRFHRFLEKRIGGIDLAWKTYILEWINDYAKKIFKDNENRFDSLKDIYNDFLKYLEGREAIEQQPNNFLGFLDAYIAKISDLEEKKHLLEFFKQFEYYVDIKTEFPKYIKMRIEKEIKLFNLEIEELIPVRFLSITKEDTFSDYIKEKELKYFSKLIPRPNSVILKHILSKDERDLFRADLFHVFNFRYWHNRSRYELADNFQEVYREWIKEL